VNDAVSPATFEEAKAQFKENYEQWQRVWAK
jgi:hypothetical protein